VPEDADTVAAVATLAAGNGHILRKHALFVHLLMLAAVLIAVSVGFN